jgi:hypothetical protein
LPKLAKELGALAVSKLKHPSLYFVGAVPGLALQVKTGSARSWILRLVIGNKRRDMGLGAYPSVSLAHARQKASEARELVRQALRLQVMWSTTQPLPTKETDWGKAPWCWQ